MVSNRRMLMVGATLAAIVSIVVPTGVASAAVTATLSKSTDLVEGDQITITLAGVPAGQGVYIQQCHQPKTGLRAATGLKCNGSLQQTDVMIWATLDGARGSQSAATPLTFTVRRNVTVGLETLSCGVSDCALFIFRDHRGPQDVSLDTVVPLTFLAEQTVKVRAIGLPKVGTAQNVGTKIVLRQASLVTVQKTKLRVVSLTPRICAVTQGATSTSVSFDRRGECSLRLVAKASGKFARVDTTLNYTVG